MFKELKAHLMTLAAANRAADANEQAISTPVSVRTLTPSTSVRALQA
jgi:hypothetical protein